MGMHNPCTMQIPNIPSQINLKQLSTESAARVETTSKKTPPQLNFKQLSPKTPRRVQIAKIPPQLNLQQLSSKTPSCQRQVKTPRQLNETTNVLTRVLCCLITITILVAISRIAKVQQLSVCNSEWLVVSIASASLDTQLFPLLYLTANTSAMILRQCSNVDTALEVVMWLNMIPLAVAGCSLVLLCVYPRCRRAFDLFTYMITASTLIELW